VTVPHLIARLSKKHLEHHNLLTDAVNALTEGAAVESTPLVISADEPSGAGFWLRLTPNTNSYQLYARESATDSWQPCSAGVGADGSPFGDLSPRQVGQFKGDPGDGNYVGVETDDRSARLTNTTGNDSALVKAAQTRAVMQWSGQNSHAVQVDDEGVKLNTREGDPHLAGVAYWDADGTLKRSQG
jgi:hypothetical protein